MFFSPISPISPKFPQDYSILSQQDKRRIAHQLSRLGKVTAAGEIESSTVTLSGHAVSLTLSDRSMHLTTRSFWENSQAVKATTKIIAITRAARSREQELIATRQAATVQTLKQAIAQRKRQLQLQYA
jgi:hypothetical protein